MKIDYTARQMLLHNLGECDAVLLVPGANMNYFTGLHFGLSERPLLAIITPDGLSFIIPELEFPKLKDRSDLAAQAFIWTDAQGYMDAFETALDTLKLHGKTIGIDGMTMRASEWLNFADLDPALNVKRIERDLLLLRARKTPAEVDAMRQAIQISEKALSLLLDWIAPGMKERTIAAKLDEEMRSLGAEGYAFSTTVLTGPRSALPHGNTSDRELGEDEFLLIDYGGMFGGYPADITRTFCLGTPSQEMLAIYDAVLRANQAAIGAAGPGVPCGVVDQAARDVIRAAGYGEYFIHRTGHGLGLEVHELPQIASGVEAPLEPGMIFTVEPGIYIAGLGGVRIEDNVLVTETGVEVLTSFPRMLSPR